MWPDRTQPPAVPCLLQGNSSGLTHATSPQSRLTPLHPRVPCRGPPPHLQGNSSGLTHATSPQSRLTPLHPRVPSRGPPPHFQGNSSGLTHVQTSPQSRPNLLRPRAPLALAQPSRLLLPCVMALRFRVTPTPTPADQVRSRCHLLLLRDGSTTVPHRYPCLRHYPTDAPLLLQLTPTHRYLILDRHCDRATPLSPLSLPPRTEMTHQPGRQFRGVETLVQAARTYGCSVPLAIAPPHGHATTGVGSSGFSACLVSLPDIHELPLDDSSGDADSKVDAHPPYPIQIGVCPQSRQTPDLGTPASQLPAVGHTRDRAATGPAAVIPHHFLDAENAFLNREEDPPHSSWASCSEPPAPMHNTNATADLSTCYGTSATLGQHKACPDRDDSERTRPVTTPSVPPSHDFA